MSMRPFSVAAAVLCFMIYLHLLHKDAFGQFIMILATAINAGFAARRQP